MNVLDWKSEQVVQWLLGLGDSIYPYCKNIDDNTFVNNNVDGKKLINLTVGDLIKLQVEKLGHQEIILEGLELLKNLHYNLDIENLQYVALKLSWKSRSLFNEIKMRENHKCQSPLPNREKVDTSTMSFVAEVLDALMIILSWMDKPPFEHFNITKMINVGIELATNAQRDTFAENPMEVIKNCCQCLADLSDTLIQIDSSRESLILQPASLDQVTIEKRPGHDDFGLVIDPLHPGVHAISEVRSESLAYQIGKIHVGDEIVKINNQTVVGWTTKNVLKLLRQEQPRPGVILTLKKRPKKQSMGGQPFRILSQEASPNIFNNLPSPREQFLAKPLPEINWKKSLHTPLKEKFKEDVKIDSPEGSEPEEEDVDDDIDSEIYLPTSSSTKDISPTQSVRSLLMRPRSTPIRRATISAGSPTKHQPYINVSEVQIWTGMFDTSKSNKSNNSDGGSKQSSASSTMQSTDSGCATMYSFNVQEKFPRPITIGPEYMNMMEATSTTSKDKTNPGEDYINLFACSTVGKRTPPPPPKLPVPKPRLNVSLSRESSIEESTSGRKKKPVPQPRSFPPKTNLSSSKSASKILIPIKNENTKIYKRYPVSTSVLPTEPSAVAASVLTNSLPPKSSSSSSDEELDLPPALPARQSSKRSNLNVPY